MNSGSFKGEFSQSNFGLGYPDPDIFVRSQWPLPCWIYIIWRVLWFLWYFIWIIVNGVHTGNQADSAAEGAKWFVYLANWTFLLTTVTFTVDLANVLYVTFSRNGSAIGSRQEQSDSRENTTDAKSEKDDVVFRGQFFLEEGIKSHTTSWYLKLVWLLYNIVTTSNILVTIVYWSLEHEGVADVHVVVVHAVNTAVVLLNLVVTAMPVRLLHVVYPVVYIVVYLLFSVIYQVADGTNLAGRDAVYKVVDWSKAYPTALSVVLGVVVIVPLVHVVVFAIYTFRIFLHAKMNSASYSPSGANSTAIFENSIPTTTTTTTTSGASNPTIFESSIPTSTSGASSVTAFENPILTRQSEGIEGNGSIEMDSLPPHPE